MMFDNEDADLTNNPRTLYREPMIISAWPGVGKTYASKNYGNLWKIHDSDSSEFHFVNSSIVSTQTKIENSDWPKNYIKHISQLRKSRKYEIIFIASHEIIREALADAGIPYVLIAPQRYALDLYVARYEERKSSKEFIQKLKDNWDEWISSCMSDKSAVLTYELDGRDYLTDIIIEQVHYHYLCWTNNIRK
jgi:hypothetical protein